MKQKPENRKIVLSEKSANRSDRGQKNRRIGGIVYQTPSFTLDRFHCHATNK